MTRRSTSRDHNRHRLSMLFTAATAALVLPSGASAFDIDSGNSDLKLRWDNTVRYNYGVRAKDCDPNICGNGTGTAGDVAAFRSDGKFSRAGNTVINRVDLLSEFDFIYKADHGFRLSAAGWYDHAYSDTSARGDDSVVAGLNPGHNPYPNGEYTSDVKRWNRGPSGELLDAFVFTRFDLGSVPVNVKAGQHNIYWGESIFSLVNGVSYQQGPVDYRKAFANPGAEAKELFKPLNQISFSAGLSDRLVVAGQYYLSWRHSTIPDGSTYFGPADFVTSEGGTTSPFFSTPFEGARSSSVKKQGDWGVAVRWRPEELDGTMGFYLRNYTPKLFNLPFDVATNTLYQDYQFGRERLFGFSLAKSIAGISFGSDITYRRDAMLAAPFAVAADNTTNWRPKGNVVSGLVNAVAYIGKTAAFDSAVLIAEVNYSRLVGVTYDPFNKRTALLDPNCGSPGNREATNHGCPTKDAWGMNVKFEPKWFQVFPGTDVSMPAYLGTGVKGNSPVLFGDNEGQGSWSLGVTADVNQQYNFSLAYNGFLAKHSNDSAGVGSNSNAVLGKYWDRDWVSFTFKTTF